MSLNCIKSVRCLSLSRRIRHYSTVSPLFNCKYLQNIVLKSISPTNECKNSFNVKVLNQIQSNNYSNEVKTPQKCWKCGHQSHPKVPSKVLLFCDNCQSILAIDRSLDYFDLFEQKLSFDLDLNRLNQRFKSLQMSTHPDKYVMSSDRERQYSEENSIFINKAYKTLRDPYERGLYLLKLFETSIQENESIGESGIDSQFLKYIMELNEDIEEKSESKGKLLNIFNDNKQNMNELMDQISEAFNSRQIIRAKQLLSKFKFFITLDNNLKEKLQILD